MFKNTITEIEDNFFEVEGLEKGEYDVQAIQYNRLISNSLYNRLMWGNMPKDYSDFCKKEHVAKPLKSTEIKRIIENNGIEITEFKTKGGMTYISGTKIPTHN